MKGSRMRKFWNKAAGLFVALMVAAVVGVTNAQAALVTYTSGEVTFTPSEIITPIITGVIAAVGAAASLVVISVGVRWLYRAVKAK